jgi:ABC-2 type transport system permease protein
MSAASKVGCIRRFGRVVLRQIIGDRTTLFFLVVLPVAVIVIIGTTFGGGGSIEIGVVSSTPSEGAAGEQFASALEDDLNRRDGVKVITFQSEEGLRRSIRRQAIDAGVVVEPPSGEGGRGEDGGRPEIVMIANPASQGALLARDVVVSALSVAFGPADAARAVAELTSIPYDTALATATAMAVAPPDASVEIIDVGDARRSDLSTFSLTAPQNLVLFVFVNALASGAAVVRMRRTGVLRRVLAGPIGAGDIVVGLVAVWFMVSMLQSLLILGVGGLLFDVDWGDPIAAALLTTAFALTGSGAGLLIGAVGGDSDRVASIAPPIGIALGALGGCMAPLEVFPDVMLKVAHATPHYWAITAWQQLIFDGEGLGAIVGSLLILGVFAVTFVSLAAIVLRRALVAT